ncbi:MAG: hypothetical protein R3Y16_07770, partial [Rikenellaceae bacterium]
EPLPKSKGYRVQISGAVDLSDGVKSLITSMGGGAKLMQLSTSQYIVGTIANNILAEELAEAISRVDGDLVLLVIAIQ